MDYLDTCVHVLNEMTAESSSDRPVAIFRTEAECSDNMDEMYDAAGVPEGRRVNIDDFQLFHFEKANKDSVADLGRYIFICNCCTKITTDQSLDVESGMRNAFKTYFANLQERYPELQQSRFEPHFVCSHVRVYKNPDKNGIFVYFTSLIGYENQECSIKIATETVEGIGMDTFFNLLGAPPQ
jgi:hypothetical protein